MKKRLYRMACAGVVIGIIGSTVSVFAERTISVEHPVEVEEQETVSVTHVGLNAGIAKALSEAMTIATSSPVETVITPEVTETNPYAPFSYDDAYLLGRIAMAEAEGEDTYSKALVIQTVLNRVSSSEFPNTIEEVIYQKDQFSPISDGRFSQVEPNEDCWSAVDLVRGSEGDITNGALYFDGCSTSDRWHNNHLDYLFTYGNINFYK